MSRDKRIFFMEVTELLEQCSHTVHSTVQSADTHSLYVVVAVDRCSCSGTEWQIF